MSSNQSNLWESAIIEEYNSLLQNNTWTLTQLPPGRNTIQTRWVFKVKAGANGTNPRYKARLVAKGFTQREGIDYTETFSPVVKLNSLRAILSLVAARDLNITQLDIKTAFLYGEINEEIYLTQPEGFIVPERKTEVCKLNKCIYGLNKPPECGIAFLTLFYRILD